MGVKKYRIVRFEIDGVSVQENNTNLRNITAMFRHSIAHSLFRDGKTARKPNGVSVNYDVYKSQQFPNLGSKIEKISFVNHYGNTYFEATIPVNDLKIFAKKLASSVLAKMGCKN